MSYYFETWDDAVRTHGKPASPATPATPACPVELCLPGERSRAIGSEIGTGSVIVGLVLVEVDRVEPLEPIRPHGQGLRRLDRP